MKQQFKTSLKKPFNIAILAFIVLLIGALIFTKYNAQFYKTPIGHITNITDQKSKNTVDQNKNKDIVHTENIKLKIVNGKYKGKTLTVPHKYTDSLTDSEKYRKGDEVLISYTGEESSAIIKGLKRDTSVVFMTGLFLFTLLMVGRKSGLYSIISLFINVSVILIMINYFMKNDNQHFFILMAITVIFSTIISLLLVSGFSKKTFVAILSTLLGTFISIGISQLIMTLTNSNGIKYETMSFLTIQPTQIFLASILIGSLGAVMDVAITLTSSLYEIKAQHPTISMKRLKQSGINIGKDIMGTMTNILFFAYLSGSIPMVILYFKNNNTVTYTLSMNWSLEISRALMGGIGIVITIPITIFIVMLFMQREEANMDTTFILAVILLILMILVGGKTGFRSFITLFLNIFTLFIAILLIIYKAPIFIVLIIFCLLIACINLFYINEYNTKTQSAFLATIITTLILIGLIYFIVDISMLQGFTEEEQDETYIFSMNIGINYAQLMVFTIVLAVIAAVIDLTISISSPMYELYEAQPNISLKQLFKSGLTIGRDILSTTTNTIYFAYIGGQITLFFWFGKLNYTFGEIINAKIFAAEIISILLGGIAVSIAIPITSIITVQLIKRRNKLNEH